MTPEGSPLTQDRAPAPTRARRTAGVPHAAAVALVLLVAGTPSALAPQEAPETTPPDRTVVPDPSTFDASAPTDDPELEARVRALASQLRCPTCQALSIADSPSELAREMEGVIRIRLQEGMSPEEIRRSFVDSYGEWILLSPEPSGFNLLVYLLPLAAVLIGSAIVITAVRRWLSTPEPERSAPVP